MGYIEKPFEGRFMTPDPKGFSQKTSSTIRKPTDLFNRSLQTHILLLTLPNDIPPPFFVIPRNGLGVSSFRTFAPELKKIRREDVEQHSVNNGTNYQTNNWCKILATNSMKEQKNPRIQVILNHSQQKSAIPVWVKSNPTHSIKDVQSFRFI